MPDKIEPPRSKGTRSGSWWSREVLTRLRLVHCAAFMSQLLIVPQVSPVADRQPWYRAHQAVSRPREGHERMIVAAFLPVAGLIGRPGAAGRADEARVVAQRGEEDVREII